MANDNQEQTLEETLNRTDFGQVINDNKKPILITGAILVVLIFAYSFYKQSSNEKLNLALANAYDFKVKVIDGYTSKKIKADEFFKQMKSMPSSIKGEVSILPSVLSASKKLVEEGKLQEASEILVSWKSHFAATSFSYFFTSLNLSQIYDDLGKKEEAISILDELKKSSIKVFKSKILLDLARIQSETSDIESAKNNLEIIVKDHKGSEEEKLAKILLAKFKS